MNFISWDRAVSLFPRATFRDKKSYVVHDCVERDGNDKAWVRTYRQLGFEVVRNGDSTLIAPEGGLRWSMDSTSWIMKLDSHSE